MEIYEFVSVDGKFKFSVKTEMLERTPKPETVDAFELITTHQLNTYLHNPSGPAVLRLEDQYGEYWIDGQRLSEEEGAKIAHHHKFTNRLQDEVNSDNTE